MAGQTDGPPKRKPWFFDGATGREFTAPNTGDEMKAAIDRIGFEAEHFPDWVIDDGPYGGLAITLSLIDRDWSKPTVLLAKTEHGEARIVAEADPSGFVRISVDWQGGPVLTAFLDRPYEQYELWPPHAEGDCEAPGHVGKRLSWVGFDAAAWPVLKPLANPYGGLTLREKDQEIVHLPDAAAPDR
ncbi:hypothetical protein SAMN02983003_1864 [Devosia enhydra]|uniref:Uncharacterized protein n=1 Tax=Devosia enhydra TaxID=665118 RepID=A0A1K2HX57_9HYPH|nr:hypothetical protein [Devosia enhydra]SFZ84182.1 hypothetical protein SAMN02983003_1864 [Devosia enhydra]